MYEIIISPGPILNRQLVKLFQPKITISDIVMLFGLLQILHCGCWNYLFYVGEFFAIFLLEKYLHLFSGSFAFV